nr:cold shock domain-containing protein [uncultured Cohaesibacter sp.]
MKTGTVKFFNAKKGCGSISPHDGAADVPVHIMDIQTAGMTSLIDGLKLSYKLQTNRGGLVSATDLKLLD